MTEVGDIIGIYVVIFAIILIGMISAIIGAQSIYETGIKGKILLGLAGILVVVDIAIWLMLCMIIDI